MHRLLLACGGVDGVVRLLLRGPDAVNFTPVCKLVGHQGWVRCVAFRQPAPSDATGRCPPADIRLAWNRIHCLACYSVRNLSALVLAASRHNTCEARCCRSPAACLSISGQEHPHMGDCARGAGRLIAYRPCNPRP